MGNDAPRVRAFFEKAVELSSAAERSAFLAEACAGQPELRARVEALLEAHFAAGSFLAIPAVGLEATIGLSPLTERSGTVIGPYKLLQQIGEGGMGVVFMAEQTAPIQRTVALKIIKPGMDSRQVIARFEAERQALAMMDHPNIAKVLDAGTTDSGRPYFVMEVVKGVPITNYCDQLHLPVRERLELMAAVCQAVQHAHQKGIIHRDIKPTNVLVAEYDGRPVPKVIDFGVAKATAQRLTEKTMFTELGQVLGTIEYMSPEQARFNQLDVDTRSDIYSLGVLLYELLTGSTPFGQKRLQASAFDEMLRIIREEEPPKPSTRLSSSDSLPSIAAQRASEPIKLSRQVRGDLDWVVMKALEKDRNRRYETANGLALDVQRYLSNDPVEAGPPTPLYRFRKFARRNRASLLVAAAVISALVLSVVGLAISNRMIAAERDEKAQALTEKGLALDLAEAQAQMTYFKDLLQYRHGDLGPQDAEELSQSVTHLLDLSAKLSLGSLPPGEVEVLERIGHRQRDLAFMVRLVGRLDLSKDAFERSILTFEKLKEQVPNKVDYWHFVADSHRELGRIAMDRKLLVEAEQEFLQAIALHEQRPENLPRLPRFFSEEAAAYYDLARLLIRTGRRDEAVPIITRGVEVGPVGDGQPVEATAQIELASLLQEAGEVDQALAIYSEIFELAEPMIPEVRFRLAEGCSQLAKLLRDKGQLEPAERMYRQAIRLREPLESVSPPSVRRAQSFDYNDLAFVLLPAERADEAEHVARKGLELKQALVSEFPENRDYRIHVAHSYLGLGHIAVDSGRTSDAVRDYGEAARILSKLAAGRAGTQQFEQFLRDTLALVEDAWRRVDRFDKATQAQQQVRARLSLLASEFPDNPDYQLEFSRSLLDTGETDAALSQCAKMISKFPNLTAFWNCRGDCLIRRGEFEDAVEAFSSSVNLEPTRSEAWTGRAYAYFQLRRWDDAVADYSKATKLAPEVHTNWYHRGHCYLQLAQWDNAAADFTKVVQGWPDEPGGWYFRALAYVQLNQADKALADLHQAVVSGYTDLHQLQTETKLDPLRQTDAFKQLLIEVESQKK